MDKYAGQATASHLVKYMVHILDLCLAFCSMEINTMRQPIDALKDIV